MANFKGTGIVVLKKLLLAKDPRLFDSFLATMLPEEKQWFDSTMALNWMPIEMATAISKKAAALLFPNDSRALFKLGQARAYENVKGIYRVFFQLINVDVVMRNAAKLWPQLHDEGRAWVEKAEGRNVAAYCVSDYPGLPGDFRKIIEGFVSGIMELTGVTNIQTKRFEEDPACWKWEATWE